MLNSWLRTRKEPISPALKAYCDSLTITSMPCNYCGIGPKGYRLVGPERDAIVADVMKFYDEKLSENEFAEKWTHMQWID